jgi:prolyl-tRNA synthetase
MRYSKLFGKTVKEVSGEIRLVSHRLLYQGGYIRESVAGRYYFLPLGIKTQDKIMAIIEEEMDKAGAQKMITPVLHPIELWQETNRTSSVGFELMSVEDQRGARFALGGTAEEMMVDLVRQFNVSYKDLPFNIYQFSQKFRDELRARGGLLRVREFMMKDAYSFHANEEDFAVEYEKMWKTYERIFSRLGLSSIVIESDNGYIGGDYCHEFVVESEVGESRYLKTEDGSYAAHEEVAVFTHEVVNPDEAEKSFEIIEQPAWVKSMEDNVKHYGKDPKYFLKNVVYKNSEGDLIIVTIRGDLDVNPIKLKNLLGEAADLTEASEEDLKLIGTKPGYVHAWGHTFVKDIPARTEKRSCKVIYVADESLKTVKNFIGGQKEETTDSINVNYERDFQHEIAGDVAMAQAGFLSPDGQSRLTEGRGIEVGNIFQLGTHYTDLMRGAVFTDADGKEKPFYMGCYGIGVGRTLATIVEKHHDEKGIIWPKSVTPYQVHLVALGKDDSVFEAAEKLETELEASGFCVLYDDRQVQAGVKLNDADLIGVPLRLVVSNRTLESDSAEWKERDQSEAEAVKLTELIDRIKVYYS